MSYIGIFEWIENTGLSIAIRESTLLYPGLITIHVLTVFFSAGTIIALDLRLLGWGLKKTPLTSVFEELRPWTLAFFVINFISGILLFWSEPVKMATTGSFIVKMSSLALLGLNALIFDNRTYRTLTGLAGADTDGAVALPGRARFAGGFSLFFWAVVIFTGRWSAYF
jgi:hypothetical protein